MVFTATSQAPGALPELIVEFSRGVLCNPMRIRENESPLSFFFFFVSSRTPCFFWPRIRSTSSKSGLSRGSQ